MYRTDNNPEQDAYTSTHSLNSLQLLPSKLFFIAKDKISKGVSSRTNKSILWQTKTFVVIIKLLLEKKFHTEFTKHNLDLLKLFNSYYLIMRRGIVFYIGLLPVFLTFSNQPKPIAISKYICWRAEGGLFTCTYSYARYLFELTTSFRFCFSYLWVRRNFLYHRILCKY